MAFVIALADDLGSEQLTCDEEMTGKNANIREGDHVTVYSYQDLFNQTRFRVSLDDQHAVG
jgi:translation initiation factor IF-1